jgi:hypothetical protein
VYRVASSGSTGCTVINGSGFGPFAQDVPKIVPVAHHVQ